MKHLSPPKFARRLFDWYCGFASVEDLQGDLEEWFYINVKSKGLRKAQLIYWRQVLALIFSYAVKKRKRDSNFGSLSSHPLSFSMIENYFKVAYRNIIRHKYFSVVNVVGLSIGMSVGLLFIAMFSNVSSYDNFHVNKENIYRIISHKTEGIETYSYASSPTALADKIESDYRGVESVVRINSSFSDEAVLEKDNIPLEGYYADDSFLSVFTFEMIEGAGRSALSKPNSIILTETIANNLFASTDVVGKLVEFKTLGSFQVTGVMKDNPKNSHLEFQVLVSYSTLPSSIRENGGNPELWSEYRNQYVYVLIPDNQLQSFEKFLEEVSKKKYPTPQNISATFELEHLPGITPGQDLRNSIGPQWELSGFIMFTAIVLLILLPACFNYTNISIARALKRSKEIGLRKTIGGQKNQIFFQFLIETIVLTFVALLGALLLFFLMRDGFHSILAESSKLDLSLTPQMAGLFMLFALFTGLMAGGIPAAYFSRLNPIQALRNQSTRAFSVTRLRKGLTVFQFFLSFCFIIALVGFARQYRYSLNYDLGFQQENILDIQLKSVNKETFKSEFSRLAPVHSISMSSGILGINPSSTWMQTSNNKDSVEVFQLFVDEAFIPAFKLELLAGKNFPVETSQHEQYIIVNEEFIKERKIQNPLDALGKTFRIDDKDLEIIGVLKNFHFVSLQLPIKSFFFRTDPSQFTHANLAVSFQDTHSALTEMENIWKKLAGNLKFEAHFFDDEIEEAYSFYDALLKVFGILGLLAISISLLGILGMVVYTSENKIKEVGIRKVMGASTLSITVLLSKDYLKLISIAAVLSIPVTVFLFDIFVSAIQHYHITLSVWDILISLLILIILGIGTITSQTLKTASANPTEALKYE